MSSDSASQRRAIRSRGISHSGLQPRWCGPETACPRGQRSSLPVRIRGCSRWSSCRTQASAGSRRSSSSAGWPP